MKNSAVDDIDNFTLPTVEELWQKVFAVRGEREANVNGQLNTAESPS
jgi:hypothetical protein